MMHHPVPHLKDGVFYYPVRVYYEDTDAGGVVYHGNYLNFCERARTEWLRTIGISQHVLRHDHLIGFVVRRAAIDYRRPAHLDDLLTVESRLNGIGKVRMTMQQLIMRSDKKLATVDIEIVCIDTSFAPTQIPDDIRAKLPLAPKIEEQEKTK